MRRFEPDYRNLMNAAWNIEAKRLPLYDHVIADSIVSEIIGKDIAPLYKGDDLDLKEYFYYYCNFLKDYGYDAVPFECLTGQVYPGGGALTHPTQEPIIKTPEDVEKYCWEEIEIRFFEKYTRYYEALRSQLPAGMKAVGGVGNGIFECVQELTGYLNLCYLSVDEPEMYRDLFRRVGQVSLNIWKRFLKEFGDIYCVLRFGDDLGFKSTTLLSDTDIRTIIIPEYKKIIDEVHCYKKPFLLHSCGKIFSVMEDLIQVAGINAKHSNEDQIAKFPVWVEQYGDRIGNFGGIDTDALCRLSKPEIKEYIRDVITQCTGHGGVAFGSGNSIPDYVPAENYVCMLETVRTIRGDEI